MTKPATEAVTTVENWGARVLESAPPFSFLFDGKPSAELLKGWEGTREEHAGKDGCVAGTERFRDPATGLECRLERTTYPDSPAVEWVMRFRNGGAADTPILADVQALDISLDVPRGAKPCLFYSKGTPVQIDWTYTIVGKALAVSARCAITVTTEDAAERSRSGAFSRRARPKPTPLPMRPSGQKSSSRRRKGSVTSIGFARRLKAMAAATRRYRPAVGRRVHRA